VCVGTGWHAVEFANVQEGDTVAVWGLGPVGMMASYYAKRVRKASRVIAIDNVPYRLEMAKSLGIEVIDFSKVDVFNPNGPKRCIDAAGFRFAKVTCTRKHIRHSLPPVPPRPVPLSELITSALVHSACVWVCVCVRLCPIS
jgi:threonine dehydrogenase-like Zn-dependent dehydrogenase